jgi:hypothetical protein
MVVQPTAALMRTPEPQSSWLALLAALALGWRLRSALPVLAVTPFLYSFVGFPAAFTAAAWEFHRRWPWKPGAWFGPLALAWAGLGVASGLYFTYVAGERLRLFLLPTHRPLLSVCAAIALVAWLVVRRELAASWRFPALALALAPLAVANQQLISGYVAQPSNFEDFFGIFAIGALLVLGSGRWPRLYPVLVAAGCGLWLVTAAAAFRTNAYVNSLVPFDAALVRALHEDPRHLVVNDRDLSSALALAFPRQGITALDYYQGTAAVADRYIADYRCIRRRVTADHPDDVRFFRTLLYIDSLYRYGGQDYIGAHLGQRDSFTLLHDVFHGCQPGDDRPLRYFISRRPLP